MKEDKRNRLLYKMLFLLVLAMVPVLVLVTIIFWQTDNRVKDYMLRDIENDTEQIMRGIDDTIINIYHVSDVFANEPELQEYLEEEYDGTDHVSKQKTVNYIIKRLFAGYDLLLQNQQIGGILTYKGELFNFLDTNYDGDEVINKLETMGVNDREKLSQFAWYPVQENFLVERSYESVREDYVVIGSRRIYSPFKNSYPYVHIFALKEQHFYEIYANVAEKYGGSIYITDGAGTLFSASDEKCLAAGMPDKELLLLLESEYEQPETVRYQDQTYVLSVEYSEVNDWQTVLLVPYSELLLYIREGFLKTLAIVILCICLSAAILLYLYRSFMNPISKIMEHMRNVYEGELESFVAVTGNQETDQMARYFNAMLMSINQNVKERLEAEKKKKELEMDVLMGQVNPHFLYNTLETIVWKAQSVKSPEIGRIAAALGRFYRLSINDGETIIPLAREIEQLMAYVSIQKARYGDDFTFELRSDSGKVRGIQVLKLILQPVVENCFMCGMPELERPMKIRLTIHVGDQWVTIRVADNGMGMDAARLREVRQQIREGRKQTIRQQTTTGRRGGSGIGLHSVQARIEVYSGKGGVWVGSRAGLGTVVVIRLPLQFIPRNGE